VKDRENAHARKKGYNRKETMIRIKKEENIAKQRNSSEWGLIA